MVTLNDIKGLSNIHNIPKAIHINKGICMDPFLEYNLTDSPRTTIYDFDVYLKDYGINLQRPYVWNLIQQQEFIMSLLLEKPIPPMILVQLDTTDSLMDKELKKYLVIDGKQRLMTIKRFIHNDFHINIGDQQVCFDHFDKDTSSLLTRQFDTLTADIYYASDNPEDPWYISDDMKITLFNFYNFAGTPQEKDHKDMLQNLLNK